MQNLLPLLALKPRTVVQVRSRDDRFHQAAENLKSALSIIGRTPNYCDLSPEFFEVVIDEASPDLDRTRKKVGEALSLWPGAVVNLTGGNSGKRRIFEDACRATRSRLIVGEPEFARP